MMLPIEQSCYWMATNAGDAEPALNGEIRTDIAVIGAGFTGLWTAHFIKQLAPGTEISVLEQRTAGYGGSGRNGGILGETIDHSHYLAIVHFGYADARRLAQIGKSNITELSDFCSENGIDCDLELTGRLYVALNNAQLDDAKKSIDAAAQLGIQDLKFLNSTEVRTELDSALYQGGVFAPGGGILDPLKLVDGLKRAAIKKGVRVFENTRVESITKNTVETTNGKIQAEKIILATDAYSHQLIPQLLKYFLPLYDYIIVSDPLTTAQMEAIRWKNRQGVTDGRTFFNYYRLTKDNRILWGTSEAVYYSPNRVAPECDHSERHYNALRESFIRHFPQIKDLNFPFAWGGPIASTTRLTPFFGSMNGGHLHYALGYTGHGIGSTRIAGNILAHMALGLPHELRELEMVQRKPFPYPPEPFRKLAVNAVTNSLRRIDEGGKQGFILRILDRLGIGFSS